MEFADVHTHQGWGSDVVHNLYPFNVDAALALHPTQPISIGIHPWYINPSTLEQEISLLRQYATLPNFYFIGETGLDKQCTTPLSLQVEVFRKHIELSAEVGKPLIVHCVGCWNEIVSFHREFNPQQLWIIHGFRGNPTLASQLLSEGFSLSLGYHFNVATLQYLRSNDISFYTETDDVPCSIQTVLQRQAIIP